LRRKRRGDSFLSSPLFTWPFARNLDRLDIRQPDGLYLARKVSKRQTTMNENLRRLVGQAERFKIHELGKLWKKTFQRSELALDSRP
jgi:hypothetical protein